MALPLLMPAVKMASSNILSKKKKGAEKKQNVLTFVSGNKNQQSSQKSSIIKVNTYKSTPTQGLIQKPEGLIQKPEGTKPSDGDIISTLSSQIKNIESSTIQLSRYISKNIKAKKERRKNQRIEREKERKKEKEEKRESKNRISSPLGPLGSVGSSIKNTSIFDFIWNFLKNVLLGRVVLSLLNNKDKIFNILDNIKNFFKETASFPEIVKTSIKVLLFAAKDSLISIGKTLSRITGKLGINKLIVNAFIGLGKGLNKFLKSLIESTKNVTKPISRAVGRAVGGAKKGFSKLSTLTKPIQDGKLIKGIQKVFGPFLPKKMLASISGKIGNLARFLKLGRIPFLSIGIDYLFNRSEGQGHLESIMRGISSGALSSLGYLAAMKAGAVLGASVGTFTIPIIGTAVGALAGTLLGFLASLVTAHYAGKFGDMVGASLYEWFTGIKRTEEIDDISTNTGSTNTGNLNLGSDNLINKVSLENLKTINGGKGPVGRSSNYGYRDGGWHGGVDIGTSGEKGWYVSFKKNGHVSLVKELDGYGKTVIINCGPYDFLFAHLESYNVRQGERYNGQIIGEIGNTGISYGEHLHFEVRPKDGAGGTDINPEPYIQYLEIGRLGDITKLNIKPDTRPDTRKNNNNNNTIKPTTSANKLTGADNVRRLASYEKSIGNSPIYVPIPSGGSDNSGGGGGSDAEVIAIPVGGSSLNSYYRQQLFASLSRHG